MNEQTIYYRFEDGSVAERITTATGEAPDSPDGATVITTEEYDAALAAIEAENQQHRDEQQAAEQARAREDYLALLAAGVPEATARRMSGYTGPPVDAEES